MIDKKGKVYYGICSMTVKIFDWISSTAISSEIIFKKSMLCFLLEEKTKPYQACKEEIRYVNIFFIFFFNNIYHQN